MAVKYSSALDRDTGAPRPGVKYVSGAKAPFGLGKEGQPFMLNFSGGSGPATTPAWVAVAIIC